MSKVLHNKYLLLATVVGFVVALDQLTKIYILTNFQLFESVTVIPNLFHITYVQNTGAAFGFLADSHPQFREIFFLSMPPIALGIIFFMLRSVEDRDRIQCLALSLVFSGAIGNYIDRLRFRYVVDFLDFTYRYESAGTSKALSWPAFNVADSAIVGGVAILLYLMFTRKEESAK
jgi:signal peptidase II